MAKFGLPIYPVYDEMCISSGMERSEIEWLLEHGAIYRRKSWVDPSKRDVFPELHSIDQDITKYKDLYVFIEYGDGYQGDDPQPELYTIRRYQWLDELLAVEGITLPTDPPDLDWTFWKWMDCKPEIFGYLEEQEPQRLQICEDGGVTLTKQELGNLNKAYQGLYEILTNAPTYIGDYFDDRKEVLNINKWSCLLKGEEYHREDWE